jgi:hypothetical protein
MRLIIQIMLMGGVVLWDHPLIGGRHNYRGGRFVMEVEVEVEKRRVIIAVVILVVVVVGVLLPVLVVLEVVTTTRRRTIVTMNDNIQVHPMDTFVVYVTFLVIGYNSVLKKMRLIISNVNNNSINNNIINVLNIGWTMVAAVAVVAVVAIIRMRGSIIVTS